MELKQLIKSIAALPSVSGHERESRDELAALIGDVFDEHYTDSVGNQMFIRRCGRENVPKILLDTHFDEIGMIVTGICDGGFLTVTNIGGVDTRILEACEVTVCGKEKFPAIVSQSASPIRKPDDGDKLTPITGLYIETGYSKEKLEEIAPLGTPVGFRPVYTDLLNDRIAGKAFDDKACGACVVYGVSGVAREDMAGDVYCLFSVQEEVTMLGGKTGAYTVDPDIALVMDVSHAAMPGTDVVMKAEDGIEISYSSLTNRRLTDKFVSVCRNGGVKVHTCADAVSTGTNANLMGLTGNGIPTVLASLPLKSMHSANEALSVADAKQLAAAVALFITDKELPEVTVYG